jgi:hypothetical protein
VASLVEELQREALDGNTDVSGLLRKAYAVATKLDLPEFKAWCERELNGYDRDLPEYRTMFGSLKAWNPYNGWIPVMGDVKVISAFSKRREGGPVGPIQDLLNSPNPDGYFIVELSPEAQDFLMQGSNMRLKVSLHIGRSGMTRILDAVRNIILEWSLKLETEGIMGEGLSFSRDEKDLAHRHREELQSIVNHITIENMVNSSIQQNSPSGKQRAR